MLDENLKIKKEYDVCRRTAGAIAKVFGITNMPEIKNVIFNNPATIIFWDDGTKTVVKCCGNEEFDKEKGLAMAISKKSMGNTGRYYRLMKKWID